MVGLRKGLLGLPPGLDPEVGLLTHGPLLVGPIRIVEGE